MSKDDPVQVNFTCNGRDISVEVPVDMRAIDLLRDVLGLTGTKEGCGKGECGACTIIVDGKTVNSCLIYAPKLEGTAVVTIEGIEKSNGSLDPIQQAFLDEGAVQCGFCTPGMVVSTKALLDENPDPAVEEIEEALSGNFCRCTGYGKIVSAVRRAAKGGES